MSEGEPPHLSYATPPPGARARGHSRWPWVVIGVIIVASSTAYGCYLGGVISFDALVGGIECVVAAAVVVGGIIAGIRYGTQDKEYWT